MKNQRGKLVNRAGQRYGRLVAISHFYKPGRGSAYWRCLCDCGGSISTRSDLLGSGATVSCGCISRQRLAEGRITHGCYKHRAFRAWEGMVARCHNPRHVAYANYGGRGISVCGEWRDSPEKFLSWADLNGWAPGLQVDRIDNDRGYSPENCRVTTSRTNNRNKRTNRTIEVQGRRITIAEASEITGINYTTLKYRMDSGWAPERVGPGVSAYDAR